MSCNLRKDKMSRDQSLLASVGFFGCTYIGRGRQHGCMGRLMIRHDSLHRFYVLRFLIFCVHLRCPSCTCTEATFVAAVRPARGPERAHRRVWDRRNWPLSSRPGDGNGRRLDADRHDQATRAPDEGRTARWMDDPAVGYSSDCSCGPWVCAFQVPSYIAHAFWPCNL